jgi:predicted RND superfamily exporter protein
MEIAVFIGFLVLLRFIVRNSRTYKILLGIILILISVPAGIFVELGLNGCCGAPSTGHEGFGFALGVILLIAGIALLVLAWKSTKK